MDIKNKISSTFILKDYSASLDFAPWNKYQVQEAVTYLSENPQALNNLLNTEEIVWPGLIAQSIEHTAYFTKLSLKTKQLNNPQILEATIKKLSTATGEQRELIAAAVSRSTSKYIETLYKKTTGQTLAKTHTKPASRISLNFSETSDKKIVAALNNTKNPNKTWQTDAIAQRLLSYGITTLPANTNLEKTAKEQYKTLKQTAKQLQEKSIPIAMISDPYLRVVAKTLEKGGTDHEILRELTYSLALDWGASGNIGTTDTLAANLLKTAEKHYPKATRRRPTNQYFQKEQVAFLQENYGAITSLWFKALKEEALERLTSAGITHLPVSRKISLTTQQQTIYNIENTSESTEPLPAEALSSFSFGINNQWGTSKNSNDKTFIVATYIPVEEIIGMSGAGLGLPTSAGEMIRESEVLLPSTYTSTTVILENSENLEEIKKVLNKKLNLNTPIKIRTRSIVKAEEKLAV